MSLIRYQASAIGLIVVQLLFGTPMAAYAQPSPSWTSGDFWRTMQVRRVLQEDPQLAPFNLGVKVVEGVAILWGPAPSLEVSQRAETRLRAVIELLYVRNQLTFDEDVPAPLLRPAVPQYLPERLPPMLPPEPRRPDVIRPHLVPKVELVGDIEPVGPITVHASPAAAQDAPTLRLHWLGTIQLPSAGRGIWSPVNR